MTTAKHTTTATPWRVDNDAMMRKQIAAQGAIPVFAYSRQFDCEAAQFEIRSRLPVEQQLANAALIVRAVNAYEELVSALRGLVAQHDRPHGFADDHWYAAALERARAAVARAEG